MSDEKLYEFFLIFDVAYKTPYGAKSLPNIFNNVNGYIGKYDGTKHIALFHYNGKMRNFFNKIRYLTMLKTIFQTFILIDIRK